MMDVVFDFAEGGPHDTLFVMLPGAHFRPSDLVDRGFVHVLRKHGRAADVVICDAHIDHYIAGDIVAGVDEIVTYATARYGYARIWLLGISLGGSGALRFAKAYPGRVEGVVLLAPFLGTRGLIAKIQRAGGFANWVAPDCHDDETSLIDWLRGFNDGSGPYPDLYLGYGESDRFAPASRLLAERLSDAHVLAQPGDHDWDTWLRLWDELLGRLPMELST